MLLKGGILKNKGEVVADISFKNQYDYKLGDKIKLATNNEVLTIVGFTDNAKFNISPVLYTSLETSNKFVMVQIPIFNLKLLTMLSSRVEKLANSLKGSKNYLSVNL